MKAVNFNSYSLPTIVMMEALVYSLQYPRSIYMVSQTMLQRITSQKTCKTKTTVLPYFNINMYMTKKCFLGSQQVQHYFLHHFTDLSIGGNINLKRNRNKCHNFFKKCHKVFLTKLLEPATNLCITDQRYQ